MIAIAQRIYAEEWAINSAEYAAQGIYRILADQLTAAAADIRSVLDIGCGRAQGLAALRAALASDSRLIGVDENPECLAAAADLLGVEVLPQNVRRMRDSVLSNGFHVSTYGDESLIDQGSLTLVQSDVIVQDPALEHLLDAAGPFDAVTLWFSGVHKARSAMELARHFEIRSDADHRTLVEDRALTIAAERLGPGGVLYTVSRIATDDLEATVQDSAQDYQAWLADWPFVLEAVTAIPYREPGTGIRVSSRDASVNAQPGYALSVLIRRVA